MAAAANIALLSDTPTSASPAAKMAAASAARDSVLDGGRTSAVDGRHRNRSICTPRVRESLPPGTNVGATVIPITTPGTVAEGIGTPRS
jgi:hypothetical protein